MTRLSSRRRCATARSFGPRRMSRARPRTACSTRWLAGSCHPAELHPGPGAPAAIDLGRRHRCEPDRAGGGLTRAGLCGGRLPHRPGDHRGARSCPAAWTLRRGLRAMAGMRRARPPGASTAFAGLREYVRGDDVRRVSWTATARRDRPVVVEVEAERGQQVIIALDCGRLMTAPAGDLDKLDHSVNAALMLAWVAQAYGDRVGMMTFDDRVTNFIKPERGAIQLRRITEALYAIKPEYVEPDFGHAMTHLALRVGRRSMVVMLTDVQDPEASRELVAHALRLAARHLVLVVAMSDPAVLSARDAPIVSTSRAYEWAAAEEFVSSRHESFEILRRGGVLGLDVVAGRLSPALVERYLELKERALL